MIVRWLLYNGILKAALLTMPGSFSSARKLSRYAGFLH